MGAFNPIDLLVLGHMPLVGISYQSREKDEEYRERFSDANSMKRVIDAAISMGVERFAATTSGSSPLASLHLHVLRGIVDEGCDIEIIPCVEIPVKLGDRRVDAFRRWATYLTFESKFYPEVEQRILDDPILNFREGWKTKLPMSKPYDREEFQNLSIDWKQIEDGLEQFVELPVTYLEPGSETDFLAMTRRFDLLGELVDMIKERGYGGVLLGVHHAGVTIPTLDEQLSGFDGYVTPLNPIGVMMFPTKTSAEKAIEDTDKAVYAIKPLAGGRVKPRKAFNYIFSFDVDGCMVGAASISEVKEDFNATIEALKAQAL
jgi:hypothetical protein